MRALLVLVPLIPVGMFFTWKFWLKAALAGGRAVRTHSLKSENSAVLKDNQRLTETLAQIEKDARDYYETSPNLAGVVLDDIAKYHREKYDS